MGKSSHWSSAIISPTRILELRILKKHSGYDFGRRGAHRAFQAEPILLKMIFKTGLQNDKQPQSQAIRIKA